MSSEDGAVAVEHVERKAEADAEPALNVSAHENLVSNEASGEEIGQSKELGMQGALFESIPTNMVLTAGLPTSQEDDEVSPAIDLTETGRDDRQSVETVHVSNERFDNGSLPNKLEDLSVESDQKESETERPDVGSYEQNDADEIVKERNATIQTNSTEVSETMISNKGASTTCSSQGLSSNDHLAESKKAVEDVVLNRTNEVVSTEPINDSCDNNEQDNDEQDQAVEVVALNKMNVMETAEPSNGSCDNNENVQSEELKELIIQANELTITRTETSPEESQLQEDSDNIPKYEGYEDLIAKELEQAEKTASEDEWLYILGHDRLRKRIIRPGEPETRPMHGQRMTIRCSGKVEGAAENSTIDEHESLSFVLGDGDFIHAFDLGVALMDRGEICELFTESRFAYGELGRVPDVPPNSNILYTIELIDYSDVPEPSALPVRTRVELGDAKRERGNELYGRQEYSRAIDLYTRALKMLDDDNESHSSVATVEDLQLLVDTRLKCYNNLAAAQIMIEAWDAAIKSCDRVLLTQPENVKALFRKAKCLTNKGELTQALAALRKAQRIEPDNKIVQQELMRLNKRCKADAASERALYQRMLGTERNPENPPSSTAPRSSTDGGRNLWYYLGAAAATAAASGWAAYRYLH